MATDATPRTSEVPRHTAAADDPSTVTTASEFYLLLDSVDSEAIGTDFELDRHSETHDFTEHVKIANYEGREVSDSLKSLAQKTGIHVGIESISDLISRDSPTTARYSHHFGMCISNWLTLIHYAVINGGNDFGDYSTRLLNTPTIYSI